MMDVTTRPIDRVLSRLEVVKEGADGWFECLCPAHEDRTPAWA